MRVFVLDQDGNPLMPTMPSRARKLIEAGVAKKVWSKFATFGIQMLVPTGTTTQVGSMGIDLGTKFEGYSVLCGNENVLNIKLDLPDKKRVVAKLEERRLRRERRSRKCRRRPARFNNRSRMGFIAPSQLVMVQSRIRIIRELARIYPITKAGLEDVCFNHAKYRWGANFSTVEIGKSRIRQTFAELHITIHEYKGWKTSETRQRYGYKKGSDKAADRFESHCSDSLTLACLVHEDQPVIPGPFLVIDDTYRCVRRKLCDTQFGKGGIKPIYSRGTVRGIQKGRFIGTSQKQGMLVGQTGKYLFLRCYTGSGRTSLSQPLFVSTQFNAKGAGVSSTPTSVWYPRPETYETGLTQCSSSDWNDVLLRPVNGLRACRNKQTLDTGATSDRVGRTDE
jgi:hypothetical protein